MAGWVKLYRSIQEHWIWEDPVKLKWWLDLIMMANHQENKILINGELVTISAGERHTSEEKLASRWGVSRNTVRKFLTLLEKDDMISIKKSRQSGTTYKVLNYNVYQGFSEEKKHQTEQRTEQQKDNGVNNELNINKNDKELKNEKNEKKKDIAGQEKPDSIPYKEIIDYLNQQAGKNFKHTAAGNKKVIKARWNEGYTLDQIKQVIDSKAADWLNDSKMNQYLQPSTLFGNKFDQYLNQQSKSIKRILEKSEEEKMLDELSRQRLAAMPIPDDSEFPF
jgi:uncharacterized phage protein (TIGR02220 family)